MRLAFKFKPNIQWLPLKEGGKISVNYTNRLVSSGVLTLKQLNKLLNKKALLVNLSYSSDIELLLEET